MMTNEADFCQKPEFGGGAYYDLGCHTAMTARHVFRAEPKLVLQPRRAMPAASACSSPSFSISAVAGTRTSWFYWQAFSQSIQIVCERAFISLPQAYVPSRASPNTIAIDTSADHANSHIHTLEFPALDQYEEEVTNFSRAIRGEAVPCFDMNDARQCGRRRRGLCLGEERYVDRGRSALDLAA